MNDLCPHCKRPMPTIAESGIFKQVLEILNQATGKKFRVAGSSNRLIAARLQEGYTLEDFRAVIRYKCSDWLGDKSRREYLRPSTLFNATHFGEYHTEAEAAPTIVKRSPVAMGSPRAVSEEERLTDSQNLAKLQELKRTLGESNG